MRNRIIIIDPLLGGGKAAPSSVLYPISLLCTYLTLPTYLPYTSLLPTLLTTMEQSGMVQHRFLSPSHCRPLRKRRLAEDVGYLKHTSYWLAVVWNKT